MNPFAYVKSPLIKGSSSKVARPNHYYSTMSVRMCWLPAKFPSYSKLYHCNMSWDLREEQWCLKCKKTNGCSVYRLRRQTLESAFLAKHRQAFQNQLCSSNLPSLSGSIAKTHNCTTPKFTLFLYKGRGKVSLCSLVWPGICGDSSAWASHVLEL